MLEAILKDAMARSLAHYRANPYMWGGWDWWQLSAEEAAVFDLEPQRWAELVPVWQAFEFFIGRTDGWNDDEIEQDYPNLEAVIKVVRAQHPDWVNLAAPVQTFMLFAKRFANASHREAKAMFAKMDFWAVRAGFTQYADEEV